MASHAQRTLFEIMRPVAIRPQVLGMITALVAIAIVVNPIGAQSNAKVTPPAFTSESANVAQIFETPDTSDSIDLSSSAGYNWELRPENGTWQPVKVPEGGWKTQGFKCDAGTYRTHIRVPAFATGHVVRLAFAAVNFGAVVFAGPDESRLQKVAEHLNGWMPFTADITAVAKPGSELLVEVQVKGREKYRLANGRFAVAEGASWSTDIADGILRGIKLQVLPHIHVEDVQIVTTRNPDLLTITVSVSNAEDHPQDVNVSGELQSWNKSFTHYPKVHPTTAAIPAHGTMSVSLPSIVWPLGPKSYWWPNVPYRPGYRAQLHTLSLQLSASGHAIESKETRFGFREFRAVGNHYELNDVHINLRGDNQQEANFGTDAYGVKSGFGHPTETNGGWPEAVDNLLRLNFNVMRIHQVPATPYMLDVADEEGLMLVGESPLRGSEGGQEDWKAGHDSMLAMDREMVLRDRNHPAIVLWSAANEWAEPMQEAITAIEQVDGTRPIIADGVNEDLGHGIINMEHYVNDLGGLPLSGGAARLDRPYGETEAIWDADNTLQGFAWMATTIRLRRAKGDADLRNYVLNNAWPNYVPGESAATEILERKVKKRGAPENWSILPAISDPWTNPHIKMIQQCYAPVAVADLDFDLLNAASNKNGDWPVVKPELRAGQLVRRTLTVFNDDLSGERVTVKWEARTPSRVLVRGAIPVLVPLGEQRSVKIAFRAPTESGDIVIAVQDWKDGVKIFSEDRMVFRGAD
jgi:hypothetical protein